MAKNQITAFGQMVKEALKQKGMTPGDLAEKLGVTKQYLYLILFGMRPGRNYLPMIEKICEINMDDMENDTEDSNETREPCEENKKPEESKMNSKETTKRRKTSKSKKKQMKKQKETHEFTPFGLKVSESLGQMNMKQVDLAREVGTSKQYLYMILHGQRSGKKYLPAIAKICQIELESVFEPESNSETETSKTND